MRHVECRRSDHSGRMGDSVSHTGSRKRNACLSMCFLSLLTNDIVCLFSLNVSFVAVRAERRLPLSFRCDARKFFVWLAIVQRRFTQCDIFSQTEENRPYWFCCALYVAGSQKVQQTLHGERDVANRKWFFRFVNARARR